MGCCQSNGGLSFSLVISDNFLKLAQVLNEQVFL